MNTTPDRAPFYEIGLDMRVGFAVADCGDDRFVDAVAQRKRHAGTVITRGLSYLHHLLVSQQGVRLLRAAQHHLRPHMRHVPVTPPHLFRVCPRPMPVAPNLRSVPHSIFGVLLNRRPIDIAGAIVEFITVAVRGLMGLARGRAVERKTNKTVHSDGNLSSANPETQHAVALAAGVRCDSAADIALHVGLDPFQPAIVGNGIAVREGYYPPGFVGIVGLSHSEAPSRGGQGRAVFNAPLRPAFYRDILAERKAA